MSLANPITASNHPTSGYRWLIVVLGMFTATCVISMPIMSLPVLFKEIADELGLNLVQIGMIWGAGSIFAIFTRLIGGAISDRFGTKRTLVAACFISGVTGIFRVFANDFNTLFATVLLSGVGLSIIPMSLHKVCGVWFSGRQLGFANSFISTGMALGFFLGSLLGATFLSPMLGGWRNVIVFYSLLAIAFSVFWSFTREPSESTGSATGAERRISLRQGLPHVARIKTVWIMGIACFGINACLHGMFGYLPLYLRSIGWTPVYADSALSTFHGMSLLATMPVAVLSDRLRSRRTILMTASVMVTVGVGILTVAEGSLVWLALILSGLLRDGYMAVFVTSIMEIPGVGATYAGTAMGLAMIFTGIGSVVSPPIGNSLAVWGPSIPFLFWSGLGAVGFLALCFLKLEPRES